MSFPKVGTAVVTRGDGRLALGRMGSLCEQVDLIFAQFPLCGLNSFFVSDVTMCAHKLLTDSGTYLSRL